MNDGSVARSRALEVAVVRAIAHPHDASEIRSGRRVTPADCPKPPDWADVRLELRRALSAADTGPVLGPVFVTTLADAQGGDELAFAAIFRDVQPVLLRYLHVISPAAADDVAAETWLQVVAGLTGFRGEERAFRAWLFTIARHRATDWGRARARRPTVPLEESGAIEMLLTPDTADVVLERISTWAVLSALATLPRDQGEIIMLRVVAGLDATDVARIVGKSPGAVRVAAHRGLRRLADVVDRSGVTL
jgi:RNA polymerase sigma-70 factor, ECF subfamily